MNKLNSVDAAKSKERPNHLVFLHNQRPPPKAIALPRFWQCYCHSLAAIAAVVVVASAAVIGACSFGRPVAVVTETSEDWLRTAETSRGRHLTPLLQTSGVAPLPSMPRSVLTEENPL